MATFLAVVQHGAPTGWSFEDVKVNSETTLLIRIFQQW